MRLPKKFEWLRPYIKQGLTHISKKHKLERVGAWSFGKSRGSKEVGAIIQKKLGEPHRIWLHTHYENADGDIVPFSRIDILTHLAHEISHMEDWKHTPRHSYLESQIKADFMEILARSGYVSEEEELSS